MYISFLNFFKEDRVDNRNTFVSVIFVFFLAIIVGFFLISNNSELNMQFALFCGQLFMLITAKFLSNDLN